MTARSGLPATVSPWQASVGSSTAGTPGTATTTVPRRGTASSRSPSPSTCGSGNAGPSAETRRSSGPSRGHAGSRWTRRPARPKRS
jgi:hypothetical protein